MNARYYDPSESLKESQGDIRLREGSIMRLSINGETIDTTEEYTFHVEGKVFAEVKRIKIGDEVRAE